MKLKNAWNKENGDGNIGAHLKPSNLEMLFSKHINKMKTKKPLVEHKTGKVLYGMEK